MTEELNSSLGNSSKKKTKIKVLEGSSYSRSIDVTRDDINIRKDYLKEKMENPYWIPNVNRDIFLLKGIYKNQDEEKRNKLHSFLPKGRSISNVHSFDRTEENTNCTVNPLKKAGLYVTEQSMNNSNIKITESEDQIPLALRKIRSKQWNSIVISPVRKLNPFNKRNGEIASSKIESVKEYLVKTKQVAQMKISMKLKEERIERMKESYINELNSMKDSIGSMLVSKEKYEEEFKRKYDDYFKWLKLEKDREEAKNKELKEHRNELEKETKKLELKISRLNEKNSQLIEYRKFIHNVSHKKTSIVSMHRKKKSQENLVRKISIMSSYRKNSFDVLLSNLNKLTDFYNNPSELIDDIRLVEQQIVLLLTYLDDYTHKAKFMKMEIAHKEKELSDKSVSESDIKSNEEFLKSLREKNKKLKEKKEEFIRHFHNKSNSSSENRLSHIHLLDKIKLISEKCIETPYAHNKNITKDQLEMMKLIECFFDNIQKKYVEYYNEMPEHVSKVEKELEIERKRLMAKELRESIHQKAVMLKNKLDEKFSRIPLKQARNTYEIKNLPLPKLLEKKSVNGKQSQPILQDLLFYETQDFI